NGAGQRLPGLGQLELKLSADAIVAVRKMHIPHPIPLCQVNVRPCAIDGNDRLDSKLLQRRKSVLAFRGTAGKDVRPERKEIVNAGRVSQRLHAGRRSFLLCRAGWVGPVKPEEKAKYQ